MNNEYSVHLVNFITDLINDIGSTAHLNNLIYHENQFVPDHEGQFVPDHALIVATQIRDTLTDDADEEVPKRMAFFDIPGVNRLQCRSILYNLINNGVNSKTAEDAVTCCQYFENHFKLFLRGKEPQLCNRIFNEYKYLVFSICGEDPKEYCGKDGYYDLTTKHCVRSDQKNAWGNDDQNGGGVGRGNQRGKKCLHRMSRTIKLRNPPRRRKIKSSRRKIKSSRRKIKSSRRK
jgi:hypothetical protein